MDDTPATIVTPWPEPPAPAAAIEVAERVLWMRLPLPMALDHVNVYALEEDNGWTIVDTGFDTGRTRGLWRDLLAGPLGGRPVTRLIVTHHHPDHVGLAGWFQSDHGATLWASRTTWLFARMLTLDEQDRPTTEMLAFWRAAGMAPDVLEKRANERPLNFADAVAPMPLGFRRLREGNVVDAAGRRWRVRIGGGHAPDHVTLWSEAGDLVLGGDQLLPSISPNLGVYATEPEADPVSDWLEACERLASHATADQLVLPGHKLPYRGLPTRLRQLADNHHGALRRLLAHLAVPHTAAECFAPLFQRRIEASEYGLALVEAVAHVNHLHQKGLVRRTRREDGAWLWQARE